MRASGTASPQSRIPSAYVVNDSGRVAVTEASFWRSEPAAVLRGFA